MKQEEKIHPLKKHAQASGACLVLVAFFCVGYFTGNGKLEAGSFGLNGSVASPTLAQVKTLLDDKFISWNSSTTLPTDRELEDGMVSGFVQAYKDPYTIYMPPKQAKSFQENVQGHFGGIGAQVGMKDGQVMIIAPLKDSPAMKAGIKAQDVVVKVNNEDTTNQNVEEVVGKIRGEIGTTVTLGVIHKGETAISSITITRDEIKMPTVDTEKRDGVFIIHLYNFNADSSELFRKALIEYLATSSSHLVIDLRGNPGGYLEAAVNIASFFVPENKLIVSEHAGKSGESKEHLSRGFNALSSKPNTRMVVLTDGGSASAAEILAGALKDHGYAKIVGEKTFGKGSVQELLDLPGGGSLKVTVAKWFTPAGVNISLQGITPDISFTASSTTKVKSIPTGDQMLDKAIIEVKKL